MPNRALWTQHLHKLMAEGVNDREELIRRTMPWVPAGHAYRHRERRRIIMGGPPEGEGRPTTMANAVAAGARGIVVTVLNNGVARGTIIKRDGRYYSRDHDTGTTTMPCQAENR